MSISAIIMLIIGGVGIWGGCALSCIIFAKKSKDDVLEENHEDASHRKWSVMHLFSWVGENM